MAKPRIIGVDLGLKRVGVAIADEDGILASPLCVLKFQGYEKLAGSLVELAKERGGTSFVVGLPLNMDGSSGEAAKRARRFARSLETVSGLPVALVDERLTTSQAEKEMIALGKSRKNRRKVIDEAAATLILENYLRRKNT